MENMNKAANKHITMRVPHTKGRGRFHMCPGIETNLFPIAVATNHPPIIIPLYLLGATLLTKEIPIGDNNNSAKVKMSYVLTKRLGFTSAT